MHDRGGAEVEVLRVKASGIDMATITPDGLPAVRLEPMRKLRVLAAIDDTGKFSDAGLGYVVASGLDVSGR